MINFLTKKRLTMFLAGLVLIVGSFYLFANKEASPTVMSTIPNNGDVEILENSQISINFNDGVTERQKGQISVLFAPLVDFDSTWLTSTFKIIPKNPLRNNTNYSVSVFLDKKQIYQFSFETSTFSQADIKKYGPSQSQNDLAFGEATKKVVEQYPWYTSLPIKTKDYVVYYDFDKQKFAITFLKAPQDSGQQNSLILDAVGRIKSIGAKEPVEYYINLPATP